MPKIVLKMGEKPDPILYTLTHFCLILGIWFITKYRQTLKLALHGFYYSIWRKYLLKDKYLKGGVLYKGETFKKRKPDGFYYDYKLQNYVFKVQASSQKIQHTT